MNGDGDDGMEVEAPLLHSTALGSPASRTQSLPPQQQSDTQLAPKAYELGTEQIKRILAFGKDLQRLYDSITVDVSSDKLKVLLQVCVPCLVS